MTTEAMASRLAAEYGATLGVGFDVIEARLPPGYTWDLSGTRSLIVSRESGETVASMWRQLISDMKFGTRS